MRTLFASLCLLMFATASLAAQPLPRFKKHTPYPTVRAQLIKLGYAPIPVKLKPGAVTQCRSNDAMCGKYPEIISCTEAGALYCNLLFQRRSDGRFFLVTTGGEPHAYKSPPDFTSVLFLSLAPPEPYHLEDVVIASAGRRGPTRPR